MPYARFVNGRFRGTTDEILQWAARKWGLPVRLLRAVAVVESWWGMSAVGDNGDSFGLFQVRRPYHCWDDCKIARRFTAFNADYYGGIIRAYFDGTQGWLNTVERGKQYRAGDLWGSVGAWFAGRWWTEPAADYVGVVRMRMRERTWLRDYFRAGLRLDSEDGRLVACMFAVRSHRISRVPSSTPREGPCRDFASRSCSSASSP